MAAAEPKPRAISTLSPRVFQYPRFLATKAKNCDPCGNHGRVILMLLAPCAIAGAGNLKPTNAAAAPAIACRRDILVEYLVSITRSVWSPFIRTYSSAHRASDARHRAVT